MSTKAGEGPAALFSFHPSESSGSQLGRGRSSKIKNYSLAFLHGGKQKPARSHQRLFPAPLPPRAGWPAGQERSSGAPSLALFPETQTEALTRGRRGAVVLAAFPPGVLAQDMLAQDMLATRSALRRGRAGTPVCCWERGKGRMGQRQAGLKKSWGLKKVMCSSGQCHLPWVRARRSGAVHFPRCHD